MSLSDKYKGALPHVNELPHPEQPIGFNSEGGTQFKPNRIVRGLLEFARSKGHDLNQIWMEWERTSRDGPTPADWEDMRQFYQLIGYTTGGYGEIFNQERGGDASDLSVGRADSEADRLRALHDTKLEGDARRRRSSSRSA